MKLKLLVMRCRWERLSASRYGRGWCCLVSVTLECMVACAGGARGSGAGRMRRKGDCLMINKGKRQDRKILGRHRGYISRSFVRVPGDLFYCVMQRRGIAAAQIHASQRDGRRQGRVRKKRKRHMPHCPQITQPPICQDHCPSAREGGRTRRGGLGELRWGALSYSLLHER